MAGRAKDAGSASEGCALADHPTTADRQQRRRAVHASRTTRTDTLTSPRPFARLLEVVDHPPAHLPAWFGPAFDARVDALVDFSKPHRPPSAKSKQAVQSGKVSVAGKSVDVGAKEREQALAASERLNIDEVDAVVLLRSFRLERNEPMVPAADAPEPPADELLVHYFSERLSILHLVQSALNNGASADSQLG